MERSILRRRPEQSDAPRDGQEGADDDPGRIHHDVVR
jgi:hypothetical protein